MSSSSTANTYAVVVWEKPTTMSSPSGSKNSAISYRKAAPDPLPTRILKRELDEEEAVSHAGVKQQRTAGQSSSQAVVSAPDVRNDQNKRPRSPDSNSPPAKRQKSGPAQPPAAGLPMEVMANICRYFRKPAEYAQAALVCENWSWHIQTALFQQVDIRTVEQYKVVNKSMDAFRDRRIREWRSNKPAAKAKITKMIIELINARKDFKRRATAIAITRKAGKPFVLDEMKLRRERIAAWYKFAELKRLVIDYPDKEEDVHNFLPFRSLTLRPEGCVKNHTNPVEYQKTTGFNDKKSFRKSQRFVMKQIVAHANDATHLTIHGRPEMMRYIMRDAPVTKPDATTDQGVKRTLHNLVSLDLSGCQTASTDHCMEWIIQALRGGPAGLQAPLLRLILFNCFSITEKVFTSIGTHLQNLQELDLSGNYTPQKRLNWKQKHADAFCGMLKQLKNLKIFRFAPRFRPPETFKLLSAILGKESLKVLELVHLDRLDIPREFTQQAANAHTQAAGLNPVVPGAPPLPIAFIGNAHHGPALDLMLKTLEVKCKKLHTFILRRSPGRAQIVTKIRDNCPELRHLEISQCGDLKSETYESLGTPRCSAMDKEGKVIGEGSDLEKLETFHLEHCAGYKRVEECIERVLENAPNLKKLVLKSHPEQRVMSMTTPLVLRAINAHKGLRHVELTYTEMIKHHQWAEFAYEYGHVQGKIQPIYDPKTDKGKGPALPNVDEKGKDKVIRENGGNPLNWRGKHLLVLNKFESRVVADEIEQIFNGPRINSRIQGPRPQEFKVSRRWVVDIRRNDKGGQAYKYQDQLELAKRNHLNREWVSDTDYYDRVYREHQRKQDEKRGRGKKGKAGKKDTKNPVASTTTATSSRPPVNTNPAVYIHERTTSAYTTQARQLPQTARATVAIKERQTPTSTAGPSTSHH
ncbi:hypothetical protein HDV00_007600 [Rhizophlyctis rosea]|nr:hypothetical protein HDV00_007600 [Rhizophlyctis rosea]